MEQRRTRRFTLQLPLAVTKTGLERVSQPGVTCNISSGGVLFISPAPPDIGGSIEYVITLSGRGEQAPGVNLRCVGKVLRADPIGTTDGDADSEFAVAATLERYEFVRSAVEMYAAQAR